MKLHNTGLTDMSQKIFAIFSFHQKQNGKMGSVICWVASARCVNGLSSVNLKASEKKPTQRGFPHWELPHQRKAWRWHNFGLSHRVPMIKLPINGRHTLKPINCQLCKIWFHTFWMAAYLFLNEAFSSFLLSINVSFETHFSKQTHIIHNQIT